jgi:hypothetical protein
MQRRIGVGRSVGRSIAPWLRAALAGAAVIVSPQLAAAAPVTYTQVIEDLDHPLSFLDVFDGARDLRRTQTLGDGSVSVEDNDATIAGQNALSANFGLSTSSPISWTHTFTFVPPAMTFLQGTLTLDVVGSNPGLFGGNDPVTVETFFVGTLVPGGTATESVTSFSTNVDAVIRTLLTDNLLSVTITPNLGSGLLADFMSIRSSTVEVTYEPIQSTAVPEPGALALLGGGLVLFAWSRGRTIFRTMAAGARRDVSGSKAWNASSACKHVRENARSVD